MDYYAGIEAGGTKIKCVVARNPENILGEFSVPTGEPESTVNQVVQKIRDFQVSTRIRIKAAGIASFGPLDLDPASDHYGWITTSPKLNWRNTPILTFIKEKLGIPVFIETDVNGAALGEGKWGAAKGLTDFAYITVGTGIGGGLIHDSKPIFGMAHPEVGHMRILRHDRDTFKGVCPYHEDCLEGLATAPSLRERWGLDPSLLPDDSPAWDLEAYYLAQAVHNLVMITSPERVILGGGVLKRAGLIEKVRALTPTMINGYVETKSLENMSQYLVLPALCDLSGALGAIALAQQYIP